MSRTRLAVVPILLALVLSKSWADEPVAVGEQGGGRVVVPTNQVLTPAGRLVTFPGRPVDLALLNKGKTVAIKNLRDLVLLETATGTILQTLPLPSGGHAVAGLAVAGAEQPFTLRRPAARSTSPAGRESRGRIAGLTRSSCPSRRSAATAHRPGWHGRRGQDAAGALGTRQHTVAARPGDWQADRCRDQDGRGPLWRDRRTGWQGLRDELGRRAAPGGGGPALSSKTPVKIDPRTGAAAWQPASVIDLSAGKVVKTIATGFDPSGLALSPDGRFVYVACATATPST